MRDHVLLHKEEAEGAYYVEMYRVPTAIPFFSSRKADFVVEVREGPELRLTYQFATCDESYAEARFKIEAMRLARKWGR